jgi:hypothetical protein
VVGRGYRIGPPGTTTKDAPDYPGEEKTGLSSDDLGKIPAYSERKPPVFSVRLLARFAVDSPSYNSALTGLPNIYPHSI